MPPPPRATAALKAMKKIGISSRVSAPVLKNLLKVYDYKWEFIEENGYRVLIGCIREHLDSEGKLCQASGVNKQDGVAGDDPEHCPKRRRKASDDPSPTMIGSDGPGESEAHRSDSKVPNRKGSTGEDTGGDVQGVHALRERVLAAEDELRRLRGVEAGLREQIDRAEQAHIDQAAMVLMVLGAEARADVAFDAGVKYVKNAFLEMHPTHASLLSFLTVTEHGSPSAAADKAPAEDGPGPGPVQKM